MRIVDMHEAESSLSKLVEAAEAGEEIVLARNGRPVARLTALNDRSAHRRIGVAEGRFTDLDPDPALDEEVSKLLGTREP
jgi:prevent-host-death family protein